ncbi:MAG TPA: hemerythrin domain-containing protein [Polyangiaceae bacterium]|nr:hemerythrin domain-containing protein [Polyangiaceae bacterium]
MSQPPNLLNDDGSASMATALMMSHHGLRRDLARFVGALQTQALEPGKVQALKEEWQSFHATLHGHHEAEDNGMFPSMRTQSEALAKTIDKLGADHRLIDPLLERGDAAFAELGAGTDEALGVVKELQSLLGPHLALEESELTPLIREAKAFPPPPDDAAADMYAKGFAWAMHGIAPGVLEQVYTMLPPVLKEKLPAARAEFDARCVRVWGPLPPLASRTPIPE